MHKIIQTTGLLLATLSATTAFASGGDPAPEPDPGNNAFIPQGAVSFIAIGDMGTGNNSQYKVAKAIEKLCQVKDCEFAIGLGDNIYETGVDSDMDEQFAEKFEQPYQNLSFPFYMALGNHDNTGSGNIVGTNNDAGEYQVAYHYRTDRSSDKWQMPARYYNFTAPLGQTDQRPLVEFYAIDSNPIVGGDVDTEYETFSYRSRHTDWMEDKMNNSSGYWRIAFAHHPYISNGKHGNAGIYDYVPLLGISYRDFLRATVCDQADFFINGHDHDLQWLKPTDSCGQTEHLLSGAGGKTRDAGDTNRNEVYFQQFNTLGFFWVHIEGNTLTAEAYAPADDNGNYTMLYQGSVEKKVGEIGNAVSQYARLRTDRGFCLEAPASAQAGDQLVAVNCDHENDQYWEMDASARIHSKLNSSLCIDGGASSGNQVSLETCGTSATQQWSWSNNMLYNQHHQAVLDMYGSESGDAVGTWSPHGGENQRWKWR